MSKNLYTIAGQALAECAYFSESRPSGDALELALEGVSSALQAVTGRPVERDSLENAYSSALFDYEKDSLLTLADGANEKSLASLWDQAGDLPRDSMGRALFSPQQAGEYVAKLMRPSTGAMSWADITGEVYFQAGEILKKTADHQEGEGTPHFNECLRMVVEIAFMSLIPSAKGRG